MVFFCHMLLAGVPPQCVSLCRSSEMIFHGHSWLPKVVRPGSPLNEEPRPTLLYIGSGRDDGDAMARQKCWWCRNWSCLRSGGTWLVHLMSVALALPLNRPAGFGIAGRQCNSLQYNGLLLFWPPPALVLVHYSTLHGWRKHWQSGNAHFLTVRRSSSLSWIRMRN